MKYSVRLCLTAVIITLTFDQFLAKSNDDPLGRPAEYAWSRLVAITGTKDVQGGWEHWASDVDLFASRKEPNCSENHRLKVLVWSVQSAELINNFAHGGPFASPKPPVSAADTEIRFNTNVCQFIKTNGLYEVGGRSKWALKGKDLEFPSGSIAVKGHWESAPCGRASRV